MPYLRVLAHSICLQAKEVKEVIIIQIGDNEQRLVATWETSGVSFQYWEQPLFDAPNNLYKPFAMMVAGHALGLHHGLNKASQPFVWFCDPDVFLLSNVDQVFLQLMEDHAVDLIGVSHFNTSSQSYLDFPCVISLMARRSFLPDREWLAGDLYIQSGMTLKENPERLLPIDGAYLLPGPPPSWNEYPNPQGIFDIGCNLWYWNKLRRGRWLAFDLEHRQTHGNFGLPQLVYPMNYTSDRFHSNFDLEADLGQKELIYHRTRGSREFADDYLNLYQSLFGETPNLPINR